MRADTSGVLSLDLGVAVDPVTAPADTVRTVTAALDRRMARGRSAITSAPPSSRDSVRSGAGPSTSVTARCGRSRRSAATPDRLSTTHAYGAGQFPVRVTARVTGRCLRRLLRARRHARSRRPCPLELDITNAASGVSGLPIEYVAARRDGRVRARRARCRTARPPPPTRPGTPRSCGHAGCRATSSCAPIVEREGFMRSGGVVIGGRAGRASSPTATWRAPTTPSDATAQRRRTGPRRPSGSSGTRRCPGTRSYPVGPDARSSDHLRRRDRPDHAGLRGGVA